MRLDSMLSNSEVLRQALTDETRTYVCTHCSAENELTKSMADWVELETG
jgi:hypothetical protein